MTFIFSPAEPARQYHAWEHRFERRQVLRRAAFVADEPVGIGAKSRAVVAWLPTG